MAIAVYFQTNGMTMDQYNEIHRRLDKLGASENSARSHHSCFGEEGALMVFDIWDSQESFEAFGATLGPILAELGVDAGQPMVMPLQAQMQTERSIRSW